MRATSLSEAAEEERETGGLNPASVISPDSVPHVRSLKAFHTPNFHFL
jgi:hypothetical protein